jgi:hypothetical protein
MRASFLIAVVLSLLSSPVLAQEEDAAPDEESGLADDSAEASEAPADPTYDRADGEGYRKHRYGDDDDYATGRRRERRDRDRDDYEDAPEDNAPAAADGKGADDDEGGRRRRDREKKGSGKAQSAPNPWAGPIAVGLCTLGAGCGCLTPVACIGTSASLGPAAAIASAPTLVVAAVVGSATGGLGHLLFADGVSAVPCLVAPISAFVLAAIFGGLGVVAGLVVGTSSDSAPLGVVAALSVLIPGVVATAAGASATYSGIAYLLADEAPAEPAADAAPATDAPEAAPPPSPAEQGATWETGPAPRRIATAMVY